MPDTHHAHTLEGASIEQWQSLEEHLDEVARRAAENASAFDSAAWGELAGKWHDLGKYAEDFQSYLRSFATDRDVLDASVLDGRPSRVDHSSAGAVHVLDRCAGRLTREKELPSAEAALAMVIAGHHAGLPERTGFEQERLAKSEKQERLRMARGGGAPADLLGLALPEPPLFLRAEAFRSLPSPKKRAKARDLRHELWTRMLFSALIDADRLDTESFMDRSQGESRKKARFGPETLPLLKDALDAHLREKARIAVDRLENSGGEIRPLAKALNDLRAEVLAHCRAAAKRPVGKHSLTVPTGGGKTLASLAFALDHALIATNNLRRVIVVLPFTSIIDQTAGVYRSVFGDALKGVVVEHHSNLDPATETYANRLASENWDAPVIVTTAVQFFESLFASKGTAARKIHNIARSVVIFDEAQTLPHHLREPIFDVLNQLVNHYGASLLLCTATQPALGLATMDRNPFPHLADVQEVMGDVEGVKAAFAKVAGRVVAEFPPDDSPTTWEALAKQVAAHDRRSLVIVQRRDDARDLCRLLPEGTFHLSGLMCSAHRREVLSRIALVLKEKDKPCLVVATTLIEAGVDLDFPVVHRDLGGIDAMAQAAGRCNREGLLPGPGRLILFNAPSKPPKGLQRGQKTTRILRTENEALDLFDPATFDRYFRSYLTGVEPDGRAVSPARAARNFPLVEEKFRMIDDDGRRPVVVPYGDAPDRIRIYEAAPGRGTLRALQPYIVTVPRDAFAVLSGSGQIETINEHVNVLRPNDPGQYDERFGLAVDRIIPRKPGDLITGDDAQ